MRRIFLLNIAFYLSCNGINKKDAIIAESPKGYRFDQGIKLKLSESLDEISGLVYYEPMHAIISIDDEEGRFYAVNPDDKSIVDSWKFGKGGDFEDLAFTGTTWFALKSNGTLFKVKNAFTDSIDSDKFPFPEDVKNEFETLYWDGSQLVLICKACPNDAGNKVSAYAFNISTNEFVKTPLYQLDYDVTKKQEKKEPNKLKPSAAAINPITKDLFILASQNRLLLIADVTGKIKEVYSLDAKVFKQPEGICFAPNGDLYVSNEAKGGIANIFKFTYHQGN